MRGCRLSDDYASPIFRYCDENPDITIKQLAKTNIKEIYSTTTRKRLGRPKKQTEVKMNESFQIWKVIAEKHKPA